MGLYSRRRSAEPDPAPPQEGAERVTGHGWRRETRDVAELSETETVRRWLRDLPGASDQQVFVSRSWGTVVAVATSRLPVGVFLSDGEKVWSAEPPNVGGSCELTPDQIEHIMLDALPSSRPPAWPVWSDLV